MRRLKLAISFIFYHFGFFILRRWKRKKDKITDYHADIAVVSIAALGDFVVFSTVARELRAQGKSLLLVCRKGTGIEKFARRTGYYKKIFAIPDGYLSRISNMRRLHEITVDTVLCAPPQRHALSDCYALSVQSKNCVLPDTMQACTLKSIKKKADSLADDLVPVSAVAELERYEKYLTAYGIRENSLQPYVFSDKEQYTTHENIIAVFPGAGAGEFKQYPVEKLARILNEVNQDASLRVLICGTQSEKAIGYDLCSRIRNGENLCGQTSLDELLSILCKARLVLTNDSGGAHLAIACGAPTVVICGGWEYGRFFPNPGLPKNCRAIVPKAIACMPCGKSKPDCIKKSVAECLRSVEETDILRAIRAVMIC